MTGERSPAISLPFGCVGRSLFLALRAYLSALSNNNPEPALFFRLCFVLACCLASGSL